MKTIFVVTERHPGYDLDSDYTDVSSAFFTEEEAAVYAALQNAKKWGGDHEVHSVQLYDDIKEAI